MQDRLIFVKVYGELRGTSFVDRIDADEAARAAGASERVACAPARALLKNLGLAVSGGHSRIFMEQGVRNTLIQGVRSNQDLNKMKDSNNQVNET